ncbi:unnamed protein product [Meloidogyne enterolobii]|uniref:Uncharacterized protein n=1 Tax=Meloidogyne enterolobii TaxID=390850 RepID=A0ACB0ZU25_MELEN
MLSLPIEVQLRILKYLNFNELLVVKQTNSYFYNLISKYEGELARRKFDGLSIWQAAIDKSIPLFLHNFESEVFLIIIENAFDNSKDRKPPYLLKLPNIPKNTEEMIIVRCWLEKLFKCAFGHCYLNKIVFNPEMINILFDNDKTTQFHVEIPLLAPTNKIFGNVLDLIFNHIISFKSLSIGLTDVDNAEQYTDILFKILINEGDKIPQISLTPFKSTKLYELIIEYITTTRECSKMVASIGLNFNPIENFKLNEKAENIEIGELHGFKQKYTRYEIANIYNPDVRFTFYNEEKNGSISYIHILK